MQFFKGETVLVKNMYIGYITVHVVKSQCVVIQEGAKQTARLVTLVIHNKGLLIRAAQGSNHTAILIRSVCLNTFINNNKVLLTLLQ